MDDETIHQDVSPEATEQAAEAEQQQEPQKPVAPRTRREERMAEVARKAAEKRDEDTKLWREMNGTPEPVSEEDTSGGSAQEDEPGTPAPAAEATDGDAGHVPAEDAGNPPAGEEQAAAEAAQADQKPENGWYTRDDGTRVKRLKVNGEIKEISEEDYDRALSKDLAGDQKLRLAAEMQRKLEAQAQALQEREQQLSQPRELPQGQSAEEMKAHLQKYHDAIYEGDTDAANAVFLEIMQGRQTSTPNIEALVDQAATRARQSIEEERQTASVQRGWNKLQSEYPEIVNDEVNLAAADAILKKVYAENPDRDPEEVILEAGRLASERLGLSKKLGHEAPATPSSQHAERMERKANLKPIPTSGGTKAHQPKAPEAPDMSPSAKIARMRAARVG